MVRWRSVELQETEMCCQTLGSLLGGTVLERWRLSVMDCSVFVVSVGMCD
jgi:hypothetical protein